MKISQRFKKMRSLWIKSKEFKALEDYLALNPNKKVMRDSLLAAFYDGFKARMDDEINELDEKLSEERKKTNFLNRN